MDTQYKNRIFKRICCVLFVIYIALICYLVFFSVEFGRAEFFDGYSRVNLVPLTEIRRFILGWRKVGAFSAFINTFGNVIGFMPLGFLCPIIFRKVRKLPLAILIGFLTSLIIETFQFVFEVGVFDIDDLILNTIGAAAGYAVYKAVRKIW